MLCILCVRRYLGSSSALEISRKWRPSAKFHSLIRRSFAGSRLRLRGRKALEPLRPPGRRILARRRNLCEDQCGLDLSSPSCRQLRKNGGFTAQRQGGFHGGQRIFTKAFKSQDRLPHKITRWQSGFASGGAGNTQRTSAREVNQISIPKISE